MEMADHALVMGGPGSNLSSTNKTKKKVNKMVIKL